jgi:hypothetical protein
MADPDLQKILDGLKKVNEAIDKAAKAAEKPPPNQAETKKPIEDAEEAKMKVVNQLPKVVGLAFSDWYFYLRFIDSNLDDASDVIVPGFSTKKDMETAKEKIREAKRWKDFLELYLKRAIKDKASEK